MNILFVADVSIQNPTSGAERVLFEQSVGLQKRGHAVHILTRRLSEHESHREIIHGVTEWRYRTDIAHMSSFIRSIMFGCKRLYESLSDAYAFDVINFHQPFSAYGVLRSPVSKEIRKIYTCHSLSFEEFQSRNPRSNNAWGKMLYLLHSAGRKRIEKKVLNASDGISVLSSFTRDKLGTVYGVASDKITIIPGGVDLLRFTPTSDKNRIREKLNLPKDKIMLFTVRDLEPRMGLENLIQAMSTVVSEYGNVYLVIGGKGPLKSRLISMSEELGISDCVTFTGFIPDEDLPDYYRMADLFVLPTIELEGFGLVTLEALASGVPVLGTPIGGTREILGALDAYYLFKDSTPESMALLISDMYRKLRNELDLQQRVTDQCRSFVELNYSWARNIEMTEKLFFAN